MEIGIFGKYEDDGGVRLGPDKVLNGHFLTDTIWIKDTGITIPVDECVFLNVADSVGCRQDIGLVVGKKYRIKYFIQTLTGGALRIGCGWDGFGITRNAAGVYEEEIICKTNSLIYLYAVGVTSGSFDYITCKEIINE